MIFPLLKIQYMGLDQINLRQPRNLTGRGEVEINVTMNSRAANTVQVTFS